MSEPPSYNDYIISPSPAKAPPTYDEALAMKHVYYVFRPVPGMTHWDRLRATRDPNNHRKYWMAVTQRPIGEKFLETFSYDILPSDSIEIKINKLPPNSLTILLHLGGVGKSPCADEVERTIRDDVEPSYQAFRLYLERAELKRAEWRIAARSCLEQERYAEFAVLADYATGEFRYFLDEVYEAVDFMMMELTKEDMRGLTDGAALYDELRGEYCQSIICTVEKYLNKAYLSYRARCVLRMYCVKSITKEGYGMNIYSMIEKLNLICLPNIWTICCIFLSGKPRREWYKGKIWKAHDDLSLGFYKNQYEKERLIDHLTPL